MRLGEIADMDEIADAAAIRRRIVGAEHIDLCALPGRGFDRDLEQMRRAHCREPSASFGIGARNVEIAQHDVAHAVRGGCVMEHDLGHQL